MSESNPFTPFVRPDLTESGWSPRWRDYLETMYDSIEAGERFLACPWWRPFKCWRLGREYRDANIAHAQATEVRDV